MKRAIFISAFTILISMLAFCDSAKQVTFQKEEKQIDVLINGKKVTSYIIADTLTKPVLYPVSTLNGLLVNRGYPFKDVKGESRDHPHHAGIFFTYDKVNDSGFWNNTHYPPQVQHTGIEQISEGDSGVLKTTSQWVNKDNKPLLLEKRKMVFIPQKNEYYLDFTITLSALDEKVIFGDTKEGMFAIRVAPWLKEEETGKYLSSNGDENEKGIWGTRAKWVKLEGNKNDQQAGIAILNHPSSVNYPTYWHVRGYGLFSANPLGQYVFQKARGVENPEPFALELEPGESTVFKFRMVIYDGARSPEEIEQIFINYQK